MASTLMMLVGFQGWAMGLAARLYVLRRELGSASRGVRWFRGWFRLERGLIIGGTVAVTGLVVLAGRLWNETAMPSEGVANDHVARIAILGLTLAATGLSTMFWSAFFDMVKMSANR